MSICFITLKGDTCVMTRMSTFMKKKETPNIFVAGFDHLMQNVRRLLLDDKMSEIHQDRDILVLGSQGSRKSAFIHSFSPDVSLEYRSVGGSSSMACGWFIDCYAFPFDSNL